jgi:manganese/zinc/iron transport system permease protein
MIAGADWGPKALWVMGSILMFIITLLILFFKELKVSTFDAGLSSAMGISPVVIHYGLMSVSSITVVGAFDAVGAILVVALMIAPAATAYLLTTDLKKMIALSVLFGVVSAISGYWLANFLDASISGSIATTLGIIFLMVYLLAPNKGLISVLHRQKQQRVEVSLITFLLHLNRHEERSERHVKHLREHINWRKVQAQKVLNLAQKNNLVEIRDDVVFLTEKGLNFTERSLEYIINNKDEKIEPMKEDFFLFRG